jgi:hypothetical protein
LFAGLLDRFTLSAGEASPQGHFVSVQCEEARHPARACSTNLHDRDRPWKAVFQNVREIVFLDQTVKQLGRARARLGELT